MDGFRGAAAAVLSAGFLFKRLLLVCLLSEVVYDSIFVTADSSEPPAWQAVENLNHQPTQNIHIQMRSEDAQSRPWLKLMENVIKSYGQRNSDQQFNHQRPLQTPHQRPLQTPHQQVVQTPHQQVVQTPHQQVVQTPHQQVVQTPHQQVVQIPYKQPHNVPVKWPHEALPSQDHSIAMPEKIEFSLNVPFPRFPLFKGISITTKKSDDDVRLSGISPHRFSRFQSQDGTGSRYMFDHKGFIMDPLKRRPSRDGARPGLDFSLSGPVFGLQEKYYSPRRPGSFAFLREKLQRRKLHPAEVGLDWSHLQQGPGHHIVLGHPHPQQIQSGCPSAYHCPQQVQHQPVFHHIVGHSNQHLNNLWPEQVSSQMPSFHPPGHHGRHDPGFPQTQQQTYVPDHANLPDESVTNPPLASQIALGRSIQNKPQVIQWPVCPRSFMV